MRYEPDISLTRFTVGCWVSTPRLTSIVVCSLFNIFHQRLG